MMRAVKVQRLTPNQVGEGELSTGTGALLVLGLIWLLAEMGHRKLSR